MISEPKGHLLIRIPKPGDGLSIILYDKEKQEILTLRDWKYSIVQYFY